MVLAEREAQSGEHTGLQILDKQHEADVLGVFQVPEARQDVAKCSDFQLHCSSHTYSFISLLTYRDCPQLPLACLNARESINLVPSLVNI